jgi:hypothetical protein
MHTKLHERQEMHYSTEPEGSSPYPPPQWQQPKKKHWVRRILFAVLGLFVLIIVISALAGNDPESPAGATGTGSATVAPGGDEVDSAKFGETVDRDGLKLAVTVPKSQTVLGEKGWCSQVTYNNGTDEPVGYGQYDWKLTDSAGDTRDVSPSQNQILSGELQPGGNKSGEVCWSGLAGTPRTVTYQPPASFDDPVSWTK